MTAQVAAPATDAVTAPLTEGQERLWFLVQLRPESADYHMHVVERLTGPLSADHRSMLTRAYDAATGAEAAVPDGSWRDHVG